MLQILAGLGKWGSATALMPAVNALYSSVARVYTVFSDITVNYAMNFDKTKFEQIANIFYVLAGVFMLFRVTIAMINYLIDPDQINDRQAGAGKMITRIVTSILMLIFFQPSGWIFGNDGILNRLEIGLIGEDGLISGFFTKDLSESNSKAMSFIYDDVLADKPLTCYYINISKNTKHGDQGLDMVINEKYKITFYPHTNGKHIIGNNYSYTSNHKDTISYKTLTGEDATTSFNEFNGTIKTFNLVEKGKEIFGSEQHRLFVNSFPNECPKQIKKVSGGYIALDKYPYGNTIDSCEPVMSGTATNLCENKGILGGFTSAEALTTFLNNLGSKNNNEVDSSDAYIKAATNGKNYTSDAIRLSQTTARSFQECADDSNEYTRKSKEEIDEYCNNQNENKCVCLQRQMFADPEADQAIMDLVANGMMSMDIISAIVAGLALIVYLIYLCVEVFIRRFKLILLVAIAPIPIISYVDPNDKYFEQWRKMYVSVYVDLFIKLFAIAIGIYLLPSVEEMKPEGFHPLITFFYITALLIFVKAVPTMISKIFGLDPSSSGTKFSDVFGMGKKVLGVGVGAPLLAAAAIGRTGKSAYDYIKTSKNRMNEKMTEQLNKLNSGEISPEQYYSARRKYRLNNALNNALMIGRVATSGFAGFFRGAGAGSTGSAGNLMTANRSSANHELDLRDSIDKGISPHKVMLEGVIKNFRLVSPKEKIEFRLKNIEEKESIIKALANSYDGIENAIKKIPQINDVVKLNARGIVSDKALKDVVMNAAKQLDANRKADGTYDGSYVMNLGQIKDLTGNVVADLSSVKAGLYSMGIDGAEQNNKTLVETVRANNDLATHLEKDYGINLTINGTGLDAAQVVKTSTFGAMTKINDEKIKLQSSREYREAKLLEEFNKKQGK